MRKRVKVPGLLPKPSKIVKRGIYEILSPNTKKRDYGKRVREGKY